MSTLFYKKSILMKPEELECLDSLEFLGQNQRNIEANTILVKIILVLIYYI